MKMSIARNTLIIVLVISMTGCSLVGPKTQIFSINSNPTGADVIINSKNVGKTPLQCQVERDEDVIIEIKKPGYLSVFQQSSTRLSKYGVLDIVGGIVWLFPFFGLFSAGAWEQKQTTFNVALDKESAEKE